VVKRLKPAWLVELLAPGRKDGLRWLVVDAWTSSGAAGKALRAGRGEGGWLVSRVTLLPLGKKRRGEEEWRLRELAAERRIPMGRVL